MNVLVVYIAFRYRLLKDGWIRGHPSQSILLDQTSKLAACDQITSYVVEPNGLTERSQFFQRIVFYDFASLFSSAPTFAKRRWNRSAPLNLA